MTLSQIVREPATIQYPDRTARPVTEMMPERSRSYLKVEMGICTGCLACERDCPIDVIKIVAEKDSELGRVLTRFDIDMSKCMYCGLCTEPCPTGAIHFIREFEKATYSLEDLVERFVPAGQKVVPYRVPKKPKVEGEGA